MYPWIVLLHVVGAFLFVLSHGASAWVVNMIRRETDVARIRALADLSSFSLAGAYIGLLLLLVGGVWAGIYAGFFSNSAWIWVALVVFVVVAVGMYAVATPFFKRLRIALGQPDRGAPKDAPPPVPAADTEIRAIAAAAPANALNAVGFLGLLVILWLMVVKPF